jgi:hypothetical protein
MPLKYSRVGHFGDKLRDVVIARQQWHYSSGGLKFQPKTHSHIKLFIRVCVHVSEIINSISVLCVLQQNFSYILVKQKSNIHQNEQLASSFNWKRDLLFLIAFKNFCFCCSLQLPSLCVLIFGVCVSVYVVYRKFFFLCMNNWKWAKRNELSD